MDVLETNRVLAYLNRANLTGVVEGQAEVWADALRDIPLTDAQDAAAQLVRERTSRDRWVTPGDIRALAESYATRRVMHARPALQIAPEGVEDHAAWQREAEFAIRRGYGFDEARTLAAKIHRAQAVEQ